MNVEQDRALRSLTESHSGPQVFDDYATAEAAAITVMLASGRQALHAEWWSTLASAPGIDIIKEESATNPGSLATSVEHHRPRVLLLDRTLLDELDTRSLRRIQQQCQHVRVLLLGDERPDDMVADVLRCRFNGFLPTTCLPDIFMKAVRAVSRGELWMSRAALASAIADLSVHPDPGDAGFPSDQAAAGSEALTARELQVVALVRRGCLNKEIARELRITEGTVKKHLQSVFAKCGVHRRIQVALRWLPCAGATRSTNQ